MNIYDVWRARKNIVKGFKRRLGHKPNLRNPKSYNEKIQWLKLNHIGNDKKIIERADKYLVRNYLKEKGLSQYLVPLYGCWDNPVDIDWDILPQSFVLKLNNGSGSKYRWFVKDKTKFSVENFLIDIEKTMHVKYGHRNGEFHYGKMAPKIIAEEYLVDNGQAIKDYKFYCFHGKVSFLSVEASKLENLHVREYLNTDWHRHPVEFYDDVPAPHTTFTKPDNLKQMVNIAEILSQGYPHVRVDLYSVDGAIYFGELTYTPENGIAKWKPQSLDFEYGKLMNIHQITH